MAEGNGRVVLVGAPLGNVGDASTRLREALAVSSSRGLPRYEIIQPQYNLYDRDGLEAELAGVADEEGLGVVSYFSLASGFLTGKYRRADDVDGRARAWLMSRPHVTPIASATSLEQLDELMGAATLELPESALQVLDQASRQDT